MDHIGRRRLLVGVATLGLVALVACGGDQPEDSLGESPSDRTPLPGEPQLVSVIGAVYSFDAPDTIGAGPTTLWFTNEGHENHNLHMMRLDDGMLIHQFAQSLHEEGLDPALELGEETVHVPAVAPGETAEATVDLPQGEYVLICLQSSPADSVAHALKGMFAPLTVTATP